MTGSPWTAWLVDGVGRDDHDFSERLRNIVRPQRVITRQAGRDGSEPCSAVVSEGQRRPVWMPKLVVSGLKWVVLQANRS